MNIVKLYNNTISDNFIWVMNIANKELFIDNKPIKNGVVFKLKESQYNMIKSMLGDVLMPVYIDSDLDFKFISGRLCNFEINGAATI